MRVVLVLALVVALGPAALAVDPPTISISYPTENAVFNAGQALIVTASGDATAGLDTQMRVEFSLYRDNPSGFAFVYDWVLMKWTTLDLAVRDNAIAKQYLDAPAGNGARHWNLPLPPLTPSGTYHLYAKAYDSLGQQGPPGPLIRDFSSRVDLPTIVMTTPAAGTTATSPATMSGTSAAVGGSIVEVDIALLRDAGAGHPAGSWNFATGAWRDGSGYIPVRATGTTAWSHALPTLGAGTYTAQAVAIDDVGNEQNVLHRFTVRSGGTTAGGTTAGTTTAGATGGSGGGGKSGGCGIGAGFAAGALLALLQARRSR